jgi:hypothetical protein
MGYEVTYNYYEKLKDSFDYDRENLKNFRKVYGKATEDYPLEKLYQALMQQLARRDIFIVDWEIFEFVRKKVASRITKSDLVIKNRKFSMKNIILENLEESDLEHCETQSQNCVVPAIAAPVMQSVPVQAPIHKPVNVASVATKPVNLVTTKSERIIKYVQFLPGRMSRPVGKFTIEKTYPVFRESLSSTGIGMTLEIADDAGNRVSVSDEHFVPAQQSLLGDEEAKFSQTSNSFVDDKKLGWGGVVKDSMPSVR